MFRTVAVTLAFAALAACGSEPTVKADGEKPSDVARKVDDAIGKDRFVDPGKWRSTVAIDDMVIPGMPADMAGQMKARMGEGRAYETCLTEAEAKRPKEDFFAGADKSCRYDRFEMGNGKIAASMRCETEGAVQTMQMDGRYSPSHYEMKMVSSATGQGPQAGMTMTMRITADRIGECDGTEDNAG